MWKLGDNYTRIFIGDINVLEEKGTKKGQATYIAPLNLLPLLTSVPGGF